MKNTLTNVAIGIAIGAVVLAGICGLAAFSQKLKAVREEGIKSGRIHVHEFGRWSEPVIPFNRSMARQFRTCEKCGESQMRYVD